MPDPGAYLQTAGQNAGYTNNEHTFSTLKRSRKRIDPHPARGSWTIRQGRPPLFGRQGPRRRLRASPPRLRPGTVSFELLHVDTGHYFPEVIDFRDRLVEESGACMHVAHVQDWIDRGDLQERPDGTRNPLQSVPLVETIAKREYDAVLGGARRDEERARAKERIFSIRDAFGGWDPRRQRPELWDLYNGGKMVGENVSVFPISNWTESDIWEYIGARGLALPSIYYSHQREVFKRNGMWLAPGDWGGPADGEELETRTVRYRTVGDMSCTGAVDSTASTPDEVLAEISISTLLERGATRADDKLSESAMEDRKKEGYF